MEKLYSLIWSTIREWTFWVQCVWFVRYAVFVLHKIKLPSFWWTAKKWRRNKQWTFDISWNKIDNKATNFPSPWDVIFFDWWVRMKNWTYTWHVAIVTKADVNKVTVLEQNALWKGDAIREHTYNYVNPKCLGWYTRA